MSLPSLADIAKRPVEIERVLSTLFESSPIVTEILVPMVEEILAVDKDLDTYAKLITIIINGISARHPLQQAQFIAAHPRIGQSVNLSALSAKEQGVNVQGAVTTPSQVLARLVHLNACYEAKYPGLRYITFVNGRTRQQIAEEMEDALGLEHTLSPDQPAITTITSVEPEGKEWCGELSRAVEAIGQIAQHRLQGLRIG